MKISAKKIRKIIKEEIEKVLNEARIPDWTGTIHDLVREPGLARGLKRGWAGSIVKTLQLALIKFGFLNHGEDDSRFGGKTKKAVIAFQEAYNKHGTQKDDWFPLEVDGIPGPETLTAMSWWDNTFKDTAKYPPQGTPQAQIPALEKSSQKLDLG